MAIEVGKIMTGTVSKLTKFGAFIDLGNRESGLVHISEVSHDYIERIEDALTVGDSVEVKVIGIDDDNKVRLSIKGARPKPMRKSQPKRKAPVGNLDDMLKKYMRDSEERLGDLKRHTEAKRGGRGGRRG